MGSYDEGISIKAAITKFGAPELIKKLNDVVNIGQPNYEANSLLDIISQGFQGIKAIVASQNARNGIYEKIKSDLIVRIQKGELVAMGLESPINSQSQPIQILPHLFSGDINWEQSELKFRNLEFSQIRILKLKIQGEEGKKDPKEGLHKFTPDQLIDENAAAELLGISARTLQGYRIKGGGPPFIKLGKIVRYKFDALNLWLLSKKKSNTIE